MPIYNVEAYGKNYKIESPIRLSREQIKEQLAAQETTGNRLRGLGANVLNGLTFGAGNILAGGVNVLNGGEFKKGRESFKKTLESYSNLHPKSAFVGEMAGSVPTFFVPGAGATKAISGLTRLAKLGKVAEFAAKPLAKAAIEGAAYGGAYGAGSGLAKAEDLASLESLRSAGKGAAINAAVGGAAGITAGALGKTVRNLTKKGAAENLVKLIGKENVDKAIAEGVAPLDNASREVMGQAENLNIRNPKANQVFWDYRAKRLPQQLENINEVADATFGKTKTNEAIEAIKTKSRNIYEPLYEEANKVGNLSTKRNLPQDIIARINELDQKIADNKEILKVAKYTTETKNPQLHQIADELPQLEAERIELGGKIDIIENPRIKQAIKEWRKLYPEFENLPDNNMRVLQGAKQRLDAAIEKNVKYGDNSQVRMYEIAKEPLQEILETVEPYKKANAEFAKMKGLLEKVEEGKKFDSLSLSDAKELAKTMTPEQREAFNAGISERLENMIHNVDKTDKTNVAGAVYNDKTLRTLENLGYAIPKELKKEAIAGANINEILGGSQTAKRTADAGLPLGAGMAANPLRLISRKLLNQAGKKFVAANDEMLAKALTDTEALRKLATLANKKGASKGMASALRNLVVMNAKNIVSEEE